MIGQSRLSLNSVASALTQVKNRKSRRRQSSSTCADDEIEFGFNIPARLVQLPAFISTPLASNASLGTAQDVDATAKGTPLQLDTLGESGVQRVVSGHRLSHTTSSTGSLSRRKSVAKVMTRVDDSMMVSPSSSSSQTPRSQTHYLRKLFADADTDRDGQITATQARTALQGLGLKVRAADMYDLLQEIEVASASDKELTSTKMLSFDGAHMLQLGINLVKAVRDGDAAKLDAHDDIIDASLERIRLSFNDFEKFAILVQHAFRFQLFEDRNDETAAHVSKAMDTKYMATDSFRMWAWQVVMMCVATYLIMIPVTIYTNSDAEMAQFFASYTSLDALVTFFLLADMALKLRCCVVTKREGITVVLDDARSIAMHYVRSYWFLLDLATLLPWRFLFLAGGDSRWLMRYDNVTEAVVDSELSGCVGGCATLREYHLRTSGATFFMVLRGIKFIEHYRYFEETGLAPITRWYVYRQFVAGQILVQCARFVVYIHTLSVIYMSINQWSRKNTNTLASLDVGPARYAEGVYVVLQCMSTAGYGDVPPQDTAQRIYFMFLFMNGWLFSAYVIGSMIGFIERGAIDSSRQAKLVEVANLMHYFGVPDALTLEVISFENYNLLTSLTKSFGHVVNELPEDMRQNLDLWLRIKVVNAIPLFADYHRSAKLQICNAFVELTFCPEEYVYMVGEEGDEMYYLSHGFIDVLNGNSHLVATKKPGDYFGELAALSASVHLRSSDAKCLTYCELFALDRSATQEIRRNFPKVDRGIDMFYQSTRQLEASKLEEAMSVRQGGLSALLSSESPAIVVQDSVGGQQSAMARPSDQSLGSARGGRSSISPRSAGRGAFHSFDEPERNSFAVIEKSSNSIHSGFDEVAEDTPNANALPGFVLPEVTLTSSCVPSGGGAINGTRAAGATLDWTLARGPSDQVASPASPHGSEDSVMSLNISAMHLHALRASLAPKSPRPDALSPPCIPLHHRTRRSPTVCSPTISPEESSIRPIRQRRRSGGRVFASGSEELVGDDLLRVLEPPSDGGENVLIPRGLLTRAPGASHHLQSAVRAGLAALHPETISRIAEMLILNELDLCSASDMPLQDDSPDAF